MTRGLLTAAMLLTGCGPSSIALDGGKGARDTASSGDTDSGGGGPDDTGGDTGEGGDCLAYGFVVGESAHLNYGAIIDGYDSTLGAYGGANLGEGSVAVNGRVECALTSGAEVHGALHVGGDPAAAYCEEWGASTSGGVHQLLSEAELADAPEPSGLPGSEGEFGLAWGEQESLSGTHHYDDFVLAYGSTLTISGPAVLVVDELRVEGATLNLDSGATLDVFVRGGASFAWGTAFNTGGAPGAVRVILGEEEPLSLANGAAVTGQLLAPRSAVEIGGTLQGGGSASTLEAAWGAALRLDQSLLCP